MSITLLLGPSLPRASCRGAQEPLWDDHVDGETGEQRDGRHELAKAICGRCPERAACRPISSSDTGVYGGHVYSNAREISCAECGHIFTDPHGRRLYCCHDCRETAKNRQRAAILRAERRSGALPGLPNCQMCDRELTEQQRLNRVRNCSEYCRKAANRQRKRARKALIAQHDPLRGAA